jgi:hypothetical protein
MGICKMDLIDDVRGDRKKRRCPHVTAEGAIHERCGFQTD